MEGTTNTKLTAPSHQLKMSIYLKQIHSILSTVGMTEKVKAMATEHLGLDFRTAYFEITLFQFILKESWLTLKHACQTEKIKDFWKLLIGESGAADVLGRGDFRWKLFMYKMTPEEYQIFSQAVGKLNKAVKEDENKIWNLFKDELDPNQLFDNLNKMGHFGEEEENYVIKVLPRSQRIASLVGKLVISEGPDKGYKILLDYCLKQKNPYLWNKMEEIYRGESIEDDRMPGQKLFTADLTLHIEESSGAMKDNEVPDFSVDIQNTNWHLDVDCKVSEQHGYNFIQGGKTIKTEAESGIYDTEVVNREIVIIGLKPDWEPTEKKVITIEEQRLNRKRRMHRDGYLLSDLGLSSIANRLGNEWELVAVNLDLTWAEIERIKLDLPGQTLNQICKALTIWCKRSDGNGNEKVQHLLNAIEKANRNDLVLELKEKYDIKVTKAVFVEVQCQKEHVIESTGSVKGTDPEVPREHIVKDTGSIYEKQEADSD